MIRENEGILQIIFSEDIYSDYPERKARVYGIIRDYLYRVGEIIREGQREGKIRREADSGTLFVMFLGLVQPAAVLWHLSDGEFDITKNGERAWQLFRDAIRIG